VNRPSLAPLAVLVALGAGFVLALLGWLAGRPGVQLALPLLVRSAE
jgi:hypothetical protein